MKQLLLAIISLLILATTANVYAGGPRLDWPEDSSDEGKDCWVEGYDAGFAGKYDKERADRCSQENDEYNRSWGYACIDSGLTKLDCDQIKQNPVNIEHESLKDENTSGSFNDGYEDGKAHRPFNKDRDSACFEYGSQYESAYKSGCQSDSTEESCELIIEGEERGEENQYCALDQDRFLQKPTSNVDLVKRIEKMVITSDYERVKLTQLQKTKSFLSAVIN